MTEQTERPRIRWVVIVRMLLFLPIWLVLTVTLAVAVVAGLGGEVHEASPAAVQGIFGGSALVSLVALGLLMRRRKGRFLVGMALFVVLLAGAWLGLHYTGQAAYERELRKWSANGWETDYAKLQPALLAPERNAAVEYEKAFNAFPPTVLDDPWLLASDKLQEIVATHSTVLTALRAAAVNPYGCVWPTPENEAQRWGLFIFSARSATLLVAEARAKVESGDVPGAIQSIVVGLQLAQHVVVIGDVESHQVRARIEAVMLEAYEKLMSDRDERFEGIGFLERMLRRITHRPLLRQTLAASPAWTLRNLRLDPDRVDMLSPLGMSLAFFTAPGQIGAGLVPWIMIPGNIHRDVAAGLAWHRRVIKVYEQPYYLQDNNAMPNFDELPAYAAFTRLGTRPKVIFAYNEEIAQHEARVQLAVLAGRLRAYKAENSQFPETLDALDNVPVDAYSGQPIGYQRQADGFVLTSAAPHGLDQKVEWRWSK